MESFCNETGIIPVLKRLLVGMTTFNKGTTFFILLVTSTFTLFICGT